MNRKCWRILYILWIIFRIWCWCSNVSIEKHIPMRTVPFIRDAPVGGGRAVAIAIGKRHQFLSSPWAHWRKCNCNRRRCHWIVFIDQMLHLIVVWNYLQFITYLPTRHALQRHSRKESVCFCAVPVHVPAVRRCQRAYFFVYSMLRTQKNSEILERRCSGMFIKCNILADTLFKLFCRASLGNMSQKLPNV